MRHARRGYISFLLFVQWASLLLLPSILPPPSPHSLLPAYAVTRALSEQVAADRAARLAAIEAFHQLQTDETLVQTLAPQAGLPIQAFKTMGINEQEQLLRLFILQKWASISSDWSSHSDFDLTLSCEPLPDCSQSIALSSHSDHLVFRPGIQVAIHQRFSNLNSSSELAPETVDS